MGPKPPDPQQTADQAQQINTGTAVTQFGLGATNQVTPWGDLTYSQIGTWNDGTPRYQATTTMAPGMQGLWDNLMAGAGSAAAGIGSPINQPGLLTSFDASGLPGLVGSAPGADDYAANRLAVENSLYARLNPQMDAARARTEQDLFNRGVRPGTEAYDRAMGLLGQQENDLRLQTVLAGGQEQSRMFGDALAGGAFQNAARGQGYNERLGAAQFANQGMQGMFGNQLTARGQPINELVALMGGTGVQNPNFINTPQPGVGGVDYAGLVDRNYQQTLDRRNNFMTGLFGLGSTLLGGFF